MPNSSRPAPAMHLMPVTQAVQPVLPAQAVPAAQAASATAAPRALRTSRTPGARGAPRTSPQPHAPRPQAELLHEVGTDTAPIRCQATNYPTGWQIAPHAHNKHQLIHALQGVMAVSTAHGHWVVPPSRGLWVPAGVTHAVRCMGELHMRSVFVQPALAPKLFMDCSVVGVSPLLRELIRAAADVQHPCAPNSRDGRLLRLMLDELRALPVLPLSLTMPSDPRIAHVCERLLKQPGDNSPLADWALHLGVADKTIQRLFMAQTGMSFGRWRQQARLLRALELLAQGDKVIDIALALGYDSPSAFTTMFKKQFGQSPSQFFEGV